MRGWGGGRKKQQNPRNRPPPLLTGRGVERSFSRVGCGRGGGGETTFCQAQTLKIQAPTGTAQDTTTTTTALAVERFKLDEYRKRLERWDKTLAARVEELNKKRKSLEEDARAHALAVQGFDMTVTRQKSLHADLDRDRQDLRAEVKALSNGSVHEELGRVKEQLRSTTTELAEAKTKLEGCWCWKKRR